MLERERAHFDSLSDKERQYYQAFRLSLVKSIEETWRDKNNWWNRVQTMTQEEIEALPNEYIRKFGTFIIRAKEMQQEAHTEVNKDLNNMYANVKNLDQVLTN